MKPSEALSKYNQGVKRVFSNYLLIKNPKIFGSIAQ
ncbi:Uncharacterised protein [Oligella ureolytica]|uniref:Uncharacterized protein n=1 Tax=Oligella ureolytica TaxID=90244 RepID=A0A378XFY4_9BURK|nr:Uncharacterised protein [Oligella ureolytica]